MSGKGPRSAAATPTGVVHVVVPEGVDDPTLPSGGNVYDRRVCDGLRLLGWTVHEHPAPGAWPHGSTQDRAALDRLLTAVEDGSVVVVDGLVGCTAPEVLAPHADRLRLVLLVHMPLLDAREGAALSVAAAVVTSSEWTRRRLLDAYDLSSDAVVAAAPGVDAAPLAHGSPDGGGLLCVAAVARHKGHDVLVAALAHIHDLPWRLTCVGALDVDPDHSTRVGDLIRAAGLEDRVVFTGPRTGDDLAKSYAAADLLVLASATEAYGMVVTEALARGLPVVASDVGGVPEALGRTAAGEQPGLLVPPGDSLAFAQALRGWLASAGERHRLRAAAAERRGSLTGWPATAVQVAGVLGRLSV
jgi:glycosyltransferase involved in cell wall biosynthesis